jgi:hypothetical protein
MPVQRSKGAQLHVRKNSPQSLIEHVDPDYRQARDRYLESTAAGPGRGGRRGSMLQHKDEVVAVDRVDGEEPAP